MKALEVHYNSMVSCLFKACENGNINIVKSYSKIVNIHTDDDSALRFAARYGHIDIVKYLIEIGANPYAMNNDALNWAKYNKHYEVEKYLDSVMFKNNKYNNRILLYIMFIIIIIFIIICTIKI